MLASKQNCVQELKGDVTDSRVSKETLFLPQLLSCHFLHYPRAPCTAAAVLPDSRRGKCDVARVGNEKMYPLFLSTSLCSVSSSHFPLAVSLQRRRKLPRAAVWHGGAPDVGSESRLFAGVAVATPGPVLLSSLKAKAMGTWSITQRWQIFIQTHSLPAFVRRGSNT